MKMEKRVQKVSIDDALAETKFGKFNYLIILISGMILLNVVLECVGISFVLPVINCDMDLSYKEKGILGAVSFLGMISSSHLWGFLADTTGRRNVMRPTLIVGYFVTVISSFSPNFWSLAILRYINGFMLAGGSATIFAYLGEFHCNQLRNRAIMSAGFITASTAFFSPLTAYAVINQGWSFYVPILDLTYKSWRIYILLLGTIGFICGLMLFYIPESPKFLLSIGKEEEAIEVLRRMYSTNTGNSPDSYKILSIRPDNDEIQRFEIKNGKNISAIFKSMWNQTVPLFMREHFRKTVLACFIQFWVFFSAHGVYMWFPYILNKVMQFTNENPDTRLDICDIMYSMDEKISRSHLNSTVSIVSGTGGECNDVLELSTYKHTLALELIFLCLFLGMGYVTGKLGRTPTLFIILFVCGVCGILSAYITVPLVAIYFHIILLVCGLATVVVNIIAVDIYPTNLRAMAVCISLMMGRIGSVAGTNVIGLLIENYCTTSLLTASLPLVLCAFLSLLLPNGEELKKKKAISDGSA